MKLAWNAIVKNEAAVIERCVSSLLPHIDCGIVVDTGSTDGTQDKIRQLFEAAGKPVEIGTAAFINFEQARNAALRRARLSKLEWDYLLLADADMELRVKQQPWLNGEKGLSYDIRQTAGAMGYYNRRLVSRDATGWYIGCTHEYLDVASAGVIDAAEFIDHADGANRPDKFRRDIALLEEALRTETRPGLIQRYHFYLAGSYFDAGDFAKAAEHYKIRTQLGGFDEEVWYAQMRYAHCLKAQGDEPGHVLELLRAYQLRPSRAEVLHDLAQHFRLRGANAASLLFSTPALSLPSPKSDLLFVNDYACSTGIREEFAISAYYQAGTRKRGAEVCDDLALNGSRQARANQYWYLEPLVNHVPSFRPRQIQIPLHDGWVAANPSIVNLAGQPTAIVRTVNYTITAEGQYAILGSDGSYSHGHPIRTRNHLVHFSDDLSVEQSHELALPPNWPEPRFDLVRGFEDSRLFKWDGRLWTLSTVRELTPEGWCQQVLAPVSPKGYGVEWVVIAPPIRQHEKNWMPWAKGDWKAGKARLQFVYRLGIVIDACANVLADHLTGIKTDRISGSSQVIAAQGHWLALVHEAATIPGRPHNRYYQHRFVMLDDDGRLLKISPPFCFHDRQIEFAAGLAYFPSTRTLVASYGVRDCEAWLAAMDVDEVLAFIKQGVTP